MQARERKAQLAALTLPGLEENLPESRLEDLWLVTEGVYYLLAGHMSCIHCMCTGTYEPPFGGKERPTPHHGVEERFILCISLATSI